MVTKICNRCGGKWKEYNALSYETLCPDCRGKKRYWFRNTQPKSKKGASFDSYTQMILGIILFLGIIALITVDMNIKYGNHGNETFGFISNGTQDKYLDLADTLQNKTTSGVSILNVFGLSIDTLWAMVQVITSTTWDVIGGNWIAVGVNYLNLGSVGSLFATILQLLLIISVGFIIIKLITKVKA